MKKIGILTYHTGFNYGASLQAYALMTTVNKLVGNCEIINFETEDFLSTREMFSRNPKSLKEVIKIITRLPYKSDLLKRQQLFDDFTDRYLVKSPLYRTEKEVIENAVNYDTIICGSDQIWNMDDSSRYAANWIYFLNFPKKQRRISYAASFGKWVNKADNYQDKFIPWLKKFDKLSVRETSGVEYLRKKGLNVSLCIDPTLLLDKEEYEKICAPKQISKKYILLFSWNGSKGVINAAKIISKKLGLPVLNIVPPPRAMFSSIERKLDVGPCEFISMIKNAEFVVTNSFHGTVFSTIFHKPYISVYDDNRPDVRMESLLKQLNFTDHLQNADSIDIGCIFNTDFNDLEEKINLVRKDSLNYLKEALNG